MAPRRRTFSIFYFILLSLNKGPALCQTVGSGTQNSVQMAKECTPSGSTSSSLMKTLLNIASAKGVLPNVLPTIQKLFPETHKLVSTEVISQPTSQDTSNGRSCQTCYTPNVVVNNANPTYPTPQPSIGIATPSIQAYPATPTLVISEGTPPPDVPSIRTCQQCYQPNMVVINEGVSASNVPNVWPCQQCFTPNVVVSPSYTSPVIANLNYQPAYPVIQQTALQPYPNIPSVVSSPMFAIPTLTPQQVSPTLPVISVTDQSCNCLAPVPVAGPLPSPPPVTQIESPINCNVQPEYIQPQVNLQIPSIPAQTYPIPIPASPILAPTPVLLPSADIGSCSYLPEPVIPVTVLEPEVTSIESDCVQPVPISLHINMPAPIIPEPIITVISTSAPASEYSPQYNYPYYPMPYPIHIVERSRSRRKSWLPILLVALLSGGCWNNCGGGCSGYQCSTNIPIPYPIPVPTNNPIVTC